MAYPKSATTGLRPFHLWDAKAKKPMRWRYYANVRNAHQGALLEARWGEVGACIEVYDARSGKLHGQYRRRIDTIQFTEA